MAQIRILEIVLQKTVIWIDPKGVKCLSMPANENGQSVIQVLVSITIMSIAMTAFVSMLTSQQREILALSEKMASLDLEKVLQASLATGSVCEYVTKTPTPLRFDSTKVSAATPQILTPSLPIYASVQGGVTGPVVAQIGQRASAFSPSAVISNIQLSITGAPSPLPPPGTPATFIGNWLITLDPTKLVRSLAPISISTTLTVDTTTPSSATIIGCQQSSTPTTSCPAGFMRIGTEGSAESYCISSTMETPAPFITAQNNCYNKPTKGHVCTPSEWQLACAIGSAGPNNMTGHFEWLASTGYPGDIAIGGPTCDTGGHGTGPMNIGYRCCIR